MYHLRSIFSIHLMRMLSLHLQLACNVLLTAFHFLSGTTVIGCAVIGRRARPNLRMARPSFVLYFLVCSMRSQGG